MKDFYPDKKLRLSQFIEELKQWGKQENHDDIKFLRDKIKRLKHKERTNLKEIEGRALGYFKRNPVGTLYYIDLNGGNDANDGLSTGQAWLTLAKYTTLTVRSPGDIAYVRAGTTEIPAATIVFDEDGLREYISIIGCDSVINDPWSDGSDVKPIIDFDGNNFNAKFSNDDFWYVDRIVFRNSGWAYTGQILAERSYGLHFKECSFKDANALGYGTYFTFGSFCFFDTCLFRANPKADLVLDGSKVRIKNCIVDGAAVYGADLQRYSKLEAVDSQFGQTTPFNTADFRIGGDSEVVLRNCIADKGIEFQHTSGIVLEEDADEVFGAHKITHNHGTITKDTGIKTGAANFSMKMEPNTNCGLCNPLTFHNGSLIEFPFDMLCSAGVEKTVTIKIRSFGAWAAYPIASELYIEFNYLSNGSTAARTAIASTQVLSHASDWVEFTVTFTPLQTGIAYGAVYLKKFEASKGCYVNMELEKEAKGHIIGAKPAIMDVVTPVYAGQDLTGSLDESIDLTGELTL